jgi:hypothetical protein
MMQAQKQLFDDPRDYADYELSAEEVKATHSLLRSIIDGSFATMVARMRCDDEHVDDSLRLVLKEEEDGG